MADRTDRKRMRIFLEKIEVKNVGLLEVWVLVYIVAVCLAAPNKSVVHTPWLASCGFLQSIRWNYLLGSDCF